MAAPDAILAAIAGFEARLLERLDERFEEHTRALRLEMHAGFDAILRRLDRLVQDQRASRLTSSTWLR